jgi:hypothetical protein
MERNFINRLLSIRQTQDDTERQRQLDTQRKAQLKEDEAKRIKEATAEENTRRINWTRNNLQPHINTVNKHYLSNTGNITISEHTEEEILKSTAVVLEWDNRGHYYHSGATSETTIDYKSLAIKRSWDKEDHVSVYGGGGSSVRIDIKQETWEDDLRDTIVDFLENPQKCHRYENFFKNDYW